MKKELPIRSILGIPFYSGRRGELLDFLAAVIAEPSSKCLVVYTPNPEQVVQAKKFPWFHQLLQKSDINLPDGEGIVWAIKQQKNSDISLTRIAGREVFVDLLSLAREQKYKVFFLGGKPGSGEAVVAKWSDMLFCQYDQGAVDITAETAAEKKRVLEKIAAYQPSLLFVAYGAPWQEKWIAENKDFLDTHGVKVAMVVGGALDYESGKVKKVPVLVSSIHLEWLWRLFWEPWRWKRQLIGLQFFVWILLGKKEL